VAAVIPGLERASQVSDTRRWFEKGIPRAFWDALRDEQLVRADAPLPGEADNAAAP
jgi:D-threo-aldose 1-dehydrogenase